MNERGVFCNRTLNLRSIRAIGYDMDYTLIHYHEAEWEKRAYQHLKEHLLKKVWPVDRLKFDPNMACRGLILDTERGNLVKANRFGFIKRASHGTRVLEFEEQQKTYSRTIVDLTESRWYFLNTLFSLSEGCMYAQLVDLLDERKIPEVMGYKELFERVRDVLEMAHMEGALKAEIIADPERFVVLDPEVPLTLLDQRESGKKLLLITNSEWSYAQPMMSYAFDRYLPKGTTWRDLFETVIVGARKPQFFSQSSPIFEIVNDEGLLKPHLGTIMPGTVYLGGSATQVERQLGLDGDEILYIGDHMFGDVKASKNVLRWRTALILRELESEIKDITEFKPTETKLAAEMVKKERLEALHAMARVKLLRKRGGYGPAEKASEAALQAKSPNF